MPTKPGRCEAVCGNWLTSRADATRKNAINDPCRIRPSTARSAIRAWRRPCAFPTRSSRFRRERTIRVSGIRTRAEPSTRVKGRRRDTVRRLIGGSVCWSPLRCCIQRSSIVADAFDQLARFLLGQPLPGCKICNLIRLVTGNLSTILLTSPGLIVGHDLPLAGSNVLSA